MNTRLRITALLREWLEMTRRELHAIQMGRWAELTRIQKAKTALQQPLTETLEQWNRENPEEAAKNPFRTEVVSLLALETRNSELLAVRKQEVREKMLLLEQALYDIRDLHPNACAATAEPA